MFRYGHGSTRWSWIKTCFRARIHCEISKAIGRAIYKNGVHRAITAELVWRLLTESPEGLFVDVGANIGCRLIDLRRIRGQLGLIGVVIGTFETHATTCMKVIMNLRGTNIEAYQFAGSSSNGQATHEYPKGSESNDGISTLQDCKAALRQDHVCKQSRWMIPSLDKKIDILNASAVEPVMNSLQDVLLAQNPCLPGRQNTGISFLKIMNCALNCCHVTDSASVTQFSPLAGI